MTEKKLIAKTVKENMKNIIAKSRYCERDVHSVDCSKDKIITKQSYKDECDLNLIVKKYETTGQLPTMIKENPQYGDFSSVPDFQQACEIVQKAETQFYALDAKTRARFQNNPVNFLEFTSDEKNMKEMISMGLAIERESPVNEKSAVDTATTKVTQKVSSEASV